MSTDPFEPGLIARLPEPPRRVALLRPSRIGDFLCAVPAFRALRAALPQAEITIITLPLLEDLARRSPHFDRFVPFPGYPGLAEQLFDPRRTAAFFAQMQDEQFDLAVQMQGSGVNSNPFALMLGARRTAGFIRPGDPPGVLDAALPLPESGHEVERVLALTRFLGIPDRGMDLEYPLWESDRQEAGRLLEGYSPPFTGLHTGARDLTRRWPLERFIQAACRLHARYGGSLVLLGGPEERGMASRLRASVRAPVIDLTGRTSLGTLGAVVERLALLVTNDSGPAHIAYACGTPVVTIFGGKDPRQYAALGEGPFKMLVHEIECRPCSYVECPIGYTCLQQIPVEQVVQAAGEVVEQALKRK